MSGSRKRQHFLWKYLPFAAVILWGAFSITNNLWYDEAYSASMVSLPWFRMIYITAVDAHSPFYYIVLKLFYYLCGGGTHFWGLKLMSLLFMLGYILLGKYYVKKLFGEKISVCFMILSILSPIMSVQAGNVRMYALAIFCMTLTGLTAYDIFLDASRKKWILFCIASICTVYCHTFALIQTFLLYLLFLGALLYTRQKEKIKPFFLCGCVVSVVFLPWLLVTCRQFILRMRYDTGSVKEHPTMYSFMDYCAEWFSALETPISTVIFLGLGLTIVLGYCAVDWMRSERNFAPALGIGALGLTILTGVLVSVYVNNCFLGRYAFPGFGFLMLFLAVGLSHISSYRLRIPVLVVAVFCFMLQYISEIELEYDRGRLDYEKFWEEQVTKEDVIIGPYVHTIFLNVYHPDARYYLNGYKSYKVPFANTEELTDPKQLADVKGNIWWICFQGGTPEALGEYYSYEEAFNFHYMYYDFVIYRLYRK